MPRTSAMSREGSGDESLNRPARATRHHLREFDPATPRPVLQQSLRVAKPPTDSTVGVFGSGTRSS